MAELFKPDLWLAVFVDGLEAHGKITGYHGPLAAQAERVGSRNGHRWCHMFSLQPSPDHLHAFGRKLGMRREWFDGDHYDLTPGKRALAVKCGAMETDIRTYALMRQSRRAQVETLPRHEAAGGLVNGLPEEGLFWLATEERGMESTITPNYTLVVEALGSRFPKSVQAARVVAANMNQRRAGAPEVKP